MTRAPAPICMFCKHFDNANDEALTCKAFPEAIPFEIIINSADHRKKVSGDKGIRFEPKNEAAKEYATDMFDGD